MENPANSSDKPVNACDNDTCPEELDVQSRESEEDEIYYDCKSDSETWDPSSNTSENSTSAAEKFSEECLGRNSNTIIIEAPHEEELNSSLTAREYTENTDSNHNNKDDQHNLLTKKETNTTDSFGKVNNCDLCKVSNLYIPSSSFCLDCEEYYCDDCATIHRSQKATKAHNISPPEPKDPTFICDTCNILGVINQAEASCEDCKELYCSPCSNIHKRQKATKSHIVVCHTELPDKSICEPCKSNGQADKVASYLCINCDEVYCYDCFCVHSKQKATKAHTLLTAPSATEELCHNCFNKGKKTSPDMFCRACTLKLCKECADAHRKDATTHDHKMRNLSNIHGGEEERRRSAFVKKEKGVEKTKLPTDHQQQRTDNSKNYEGEMKPGRPGIVGQVKIDSVNLTWDPPELLLSGHSYQLRFKEIAPDSKWTFYPDYIQQTSLNLSNLKSDTKYVFQVRMVGEDKEGPYSEQSDSVQTVQSAATRMMDFMDDVERCDVHMPLKKLPLQEIKKARDMKSKTRKLVVGSAKKTNCMERTIMLVGATGSGKSTLVDGMINYILGVSWNDPYRLKVVDLESDEIQRDNNQGLSQTQWITCYTIYPLSGSRLDYTLHIIDTPGFGDTRGIERDKEIVDQIRTLFSKDDESGVVFIDAVCFLIKAPDARLTPTQVYIFNAIMSLFGQDIEHNFCMLITFADGKRPPVLSALKEANLPHDQHFPFNNSGLFAENSGEHVSNFSSMFWKMGCESFGIFFHKLISMETKSLKQTRDVLEQRERIELSIENLQPKLDAGLNKVEELRIEIRILEDFKTQIEANSDFKYMVSETEQRQIDLPPRQHVTNCLNCHITCHKNCMIPNDEDKRNCKAMNYEGFCTQCSGGCFWDMHRNTPYIFEYITVTKEKTYTEKLEKYRYAQDENMTRQKVVDRMQDELITLEGEILDLMEAINECNKILREIALRPDPLSVVEHIDILIESEKQEKRSGFQARISSLQQCRRKATIGDEVERFTSSFIDTKRVVRGHVSVTSPGKQKKNKKTGKPGIFQTVVNYFQE